MNAKIKKILMWGVPLLVIGGGIVWWMMPKQIAPDVRYATAAIERGSITQTVAANGTLNPVVLVNVGTQVSGTVSKLLVDFNDQVKEGDVLLEIDPVLLRSQLQESEASRASAQASLDLAQANEKRMRDLYAKEFVSRQELDSAVQSLKAAEAQLVSANARAEHDRANLDYAVIRSPVSGVVVSRSVDIGQTVAASFQTPTLFTIAQDLAHMQINTSYAEADVGSIRVGQPATFRVDAFPNRVFKGEVHQVRLNPTTTQNVVTYDVVISVDNPELILLPGMTAYVSITVAQKDDVLVAPNAALRFRPLDAAPPTGAGGGAGQRPARGKGGEVAPMGTVYVLENGQPKALRVPVGITDNRVTEVLDGDLKQGMNIIVEDRAPPKAAAGGAAPPGGRSPMRLF
ncbi:MAG: efflux RND transporter periplasmic adaptor subunit [Gallionellaceae bacterium]|jgi:HlyD family secretion protein|nr:efflux RND transporter periplasmic adaptor subunit [Gallionellaceae bacterium]